MIASDATEKGEGEPHGEENGDDNAEVHEALESLAPFAEYSIHYLVGRPRRKREV